MIITNKYSITSLYLILINFYPSVFAWESRQLSYQQLQWAPDSQSFIFVGGGDDGEDGYLPDMVFQYDFVSQRAISLKPRIYWYMLSPSQRWLVFADVYGIYFLELTKGRKPKSQILYIQSEVRSGFGRRNDDNPWDLVGFSKDESSFIYADKYNWEREYKEEEAKYLETPSYYRVTIQTGESSGEHSFSRQEIKLNFSCEAYNTYTRYSRRLFSYNESSDNKCDTKDVSKDSFRTEVDQIDFDTIPSWVHKTPIPKQPCLTNTPLIENTGVYTLQFTQGQGSLAYSRLQQYAAYLDALSLRPRLVKYKNNPYFQLNWGDFQQKTSAKAAQQCLMKQFQLNTKLVKPPQKQHEYDYNIETFPLKSWGRVTAPDSSKTVYIKIQFHLSYAPLTEIWLDTHDEKNDKKLVGSIQNNN